jgi:hypothetical protein
LLAARLLTDTIRSDLHGSPEYQLWIYCFLNRQGLAGPLGLGQPALDHFLSGFNAAGPGMFMVDIGYGKEAADGRIRGGSIS